MVALFTSGSGESCAQFSITNMARNKTHFVPTNNVQKRMKIITYHSTKSGNQKWLGLLYLNIRTGLPKALTIAVCIAIFDQFRNKLRHSLCGQLKWKFDSRKYWHISILQVDLYTNMASTFGVKTKYQIPESECNRKRFSYYRPSRTCQYIQFVTRFVPQNKWKS